MTGADSLVQNIAQPDSTKSTKKSTPHLHQNQQRINGCTSRGKTPGPPRACRSARGPPGLPHGQHVGHQGVPPRSARGPPRAATTISTWATKGTTTISTWTPEHHHDQRGPPRGAPRSARGPPGGHHHDQHVDHQEEHHQEQHVGPQEVSS